MTLLDAPPRQSRSAPADPRERVARAALACIARWGVAKTTLDDVAREAGLSRATVYRIIPGGKDALLRSLLDDEIESFVSGVSTRVSAATDLEEALVAGMHEAGTRLLDHPALGVLLAYEPELVLPHVSFAGMDRLLGYASDFGGPLLERWLTPPAARRSAEWAARLVLSYVSCPSDDVDLRNEAAVRRLVRTFVLPGIPSGPMALSTNAR